jgi:hypothetical protein
LSGSTGHKARSCLAFRAVLILKRFVKTKRLQQERVSFLDNIRAHGKEKRRVFQEKNLAFSHEY